MVNADIIELNTEQNDAQAIYESYFKHNNRSERQIEAFIHHKKLHLISGKAIGEDIIKKIKENIIKLRPPQLKALGILAVSALSKTQIEALIHHKKLNFISGKAIYEDFIEKIEKNIIKLTDEQLEALDKFAVSA